MEESLLFDSSNDPNRSSMTARNGYALTVLKGEQRKEEKKTNLNGRSLLRNNDDHRLEMKVGRPSLLIGGITGDRGSFVPSTVKVAG